MSTPAVSCLAVAEKSRVVVVMNSCKRKVLVVFTCLQKTSDLNLKPTLYPHDFPRVNLLVNISRHVIFPRTRGPDI